MLPLLALLHVAAEGGNAAREPGRRAGGPRAGRTARSSTTARPSDAVASAPTVEVTSVRASCGAWNRSSAIAITAETSRMPRTCATAQASRTSTQRCGAESPGSASERKTSSATPLQSGSSARLKANLTSWRSWLLRRFTISATSVPTSCPISRAAGRAEQQAECEPDLRQRERVRLLAELEVNDEDLGEEEREREPAPRRRGSFRTRARRSARSANAHTATQTSASDAVEDPDARGARRASRSAPSGRRPRPALGGGRRSRLESPAPPATYQPQLAPAMRTCRPRAQPLQLLPLHELRSTCCLDQLEPLQRSCPTSECRDQLEPLHELPLQELPDQLEPLHELPVQLAPVQVLPFQVPPDQLVPAASSAAIAAESNGRPKMSCSPLSTTPSSRGGRCRAAASSEPRAVRDRVEPLRVRSRGGVAVSSAVQVELAGALDERVEARQRVGAARVSTP